MSSSSHILAPDAQAVFLLCGRLGSHDDSSGKPLTRNQYNEVATWLHRNNMRPENLLEEEGRKQLSAFGEDGNLTEGRLCTLLGRGAAMAMAVEEWTNKGGWIVARSDGHYPKRFKKRLRHLAPPILYGVGDPKLLEHGGVSMVGSRNSDDASLSFVRDLARRCAEEGVSVVSGGARGVDQASMDAALEADGMVVGALANGLAKTSRKKKYREAIADDRLTLVSAYHPNSRFQVWKAMGRNKHIYALGDGTVVAHSAEGSGGTWAGATENLEHAWVPLFVRAEAPVSDGNRKLIEMGGRPIDRRVLREGVRVERWLHDADFLYELESVATLFSSSASHRNERPDSLDTSAHESTKRENKEASQREAEESTELFPLVWPAIKALLDEPCGEQEVRAHFDDLHLGQARDWLKEAVERGLAVREERPVRYSLPEGEPAQNDVQGNSLSNRSSEAKKDQKISASGDGETRLSKQQALKL